MLQPDCKFCFPLKSLNIFIKCVASLQQYFDGNYLVTLLFLGFVYNTHTTPADLSVDKKGCPVDAPDNDFDGVADYLDNCPATPEGYIVDPNGCFLDDDGDGVLNERDRCPSNPPGFQVDENGCTQLIRRSKG